MINGWPLELVVIVGGAGVLGVDFLLGKFCESFLGWRINKLAQSAFLSLGFALFWENFALVWVLVFFGVITIREVVLNFFDNKGGGKVDDIFFDLVETERKAEELGIDFEKFSWDLFQKGKYNKEDLESHLSSLIERIEIESSKRNIDLEKNDQGI